MNDILEKIDFQKYFQPKYSCRKLLPKNPDPDQKHGKNYGKDPLKLKKSI